MNEVRGGQSEIVNLVQWMQVWEVPKRGPAEQLSYHVSPQEMGGQLMALEVSAANPDLGQ